MKGSVASLEEERTALLDENREWEERTAAQGQSTVNGHDAAEPAVVQAADASAGGQSDSSNGMETGIEPSSLAALAPDQIGQGFASVARSPKIEFPSDQEIALRHAYSVINDLERRLEESNQALSARNFELESARAEALAATAARHEIETRLVRAARTWPANWLCWRRR